uniref:Uncharacterized protein n=1 Tax=Amphimedon queenslandica TaxID=400682 RepID=A0A1X7VKZ6_AMPQE
VNFMSINVNVKMVNLTTKQNVTIIDKRALMADFKIDLKNGKYQPCTWYNSDTHPMDRASSFPPISSGFISNDSIEWLILYISQE